MEEELIPLNIEVGFVKTDPELIKMLFARLSKEERAEGEVAYTDEKQVRMLMRYNVWTINQFADVSGLGVSTVTNLTRPILEGGTKIVLKLNTCYPFPDSFGKGPKFIVRNEKSERYIKV